MPAFEKKGGARLVVPVITLLAGIGMIAVGAAVGMSGVNAAFIRDFTITLNAFGALSYISALNGVTISVAGGAILIASGVLGLIANFLNLRRFFIATVILNIVGASVIVAGAVLFSTFISLSDVMQTTVPNANKTPMSAPYQSIHMWGLATFEACCYDAGYKSQEKIIPCGTNVCPALTDPRIQDYASTIDLTKLCTCIEKPDVYNAGLAKIKSSQICTTFTKTKLKFDPNLEIPTTPLTLKMILDKQYPGTTVESFPLVGYNDKPTFGCILGYWKGIGWFATLYAIQEFTIVRNLAFVFAAIAFLANIIGFAISYLNAAQNQEGEALMNDGKGNNALTPVGSFQAAATPSSNYSQQDIAGRLRDFYAKYDPSKTETDIQNVSSWALKNGLPTLNAKLREKYGADLGIN